MSICIYHGNCSDGFDRLCDEDGCNEESHCGWPTGDKSDKWGGYRMTCGMHMATHNVMVSGLPQASPLHLKLGIAF